MSNIPGRSWTAAGTLGLFLFVARQTRPVATALGNEATVRTVNQERVPISRHGGDDERIGGLSGVWVDQSIDCHVDCRP